MEHPEVVGVLIAEPLPRQDREDLFGRQAARALDQRIRDLRPAVGKAVERILRRVFDQLILRQVNSWASETTGVSTAARQMPTPRIAGFFMSVALLSRPDRRCQSVSAACNMARV